MTRTQIILASILGVPYLWIALLILVRRHQRRKRWYVTKHPTKDRAKLRKMVILDDFEDKLTS